MIQIVVGPVWGRITTAIPDSVSEALSDHCSFLVDGYEWMPQYKNTAWDGTIRLYNKKARKFRVGLLDAILKFLHDTSGASIQLINETKRSKPQHKWRAVGVESRKYQQETIKTALSLRRGVLAVATGGGKTVIASSIIAKRGLPTTFVVHTKELLYQAREMIAKYTDIKQVGQVGDGVIDIQPVTVATLQTLSRAANVKFETQKYADEVVAKWSDNHTDYEKRRGDLAALLQQTRVLIFDEVHHVAAPTAYDLTARFIGVQDVYGLSATPWRDTNDTLQIEAAIGPTIAAVSASDLIEMGYLARPTIAFYKVAGSSSKSARTYAAAYKSEIVNNELRNCIVRDTAQRWAADRGFVLVLTRYIDHGRELADMIPGAEFICGSHGTAVRRDAIDRFRSGELRCLTATRQLLGEGVDIPEVRGLINASAMRSSVAAIQTIGRALRTCKGKDGVDVLDFNDTGHKFFRAAYRSRRTAYEREPAFEILG